MNNTLTIKNLVVKVEGKQILHDFNLKIKSDELHVLMGPNGSGKSTFANTIVANPRYHAIHGKLKLNDLDLLSLNTTQRANEGIFVSFQNPVEVPGVRVQNILRLVHQHRFANEPDKQFVKALDFRKYLAKLVTELGFNQSFLTRGLNENFSGGEKKQLEIIQMMLLQPKFAILDEVDSGLDLDMLKLVALGIKTVVKRYHTGVILITHNQQFAKYVQPDDVHIIMNGSIIKSGQIDILDGLDQTGYANLEKGKQ